MTVQLLLALSLLVVIHEFGHYLAAKAFGVRVKKFYLFFDFPMFFTAPTFALFRAKNINRMGHRILPAWWLLCNRRNG